MKKFHTCTVYRTDFRWRKGRGAPRRPIGLYFVKTMELKNQRNTFVRQNEKKKK